MVKGNTLSREKSSKLTILTDELYVEIMNHIDKVYFKSKGYHIVYKSGFGTMMPMSTTVAKDNKLTCMYSYLFKLDIGGTIEENKSKIPVVMEVIRYHLSEMLRGGDLEIAYKVRGTCLVVQVIYKYEIVHNDMI